jgi:toxin ParE1/3/4
MVPIIWAEPALDDLREIRDYISRDSKIYARSTVKRIRAKAGLLGQMPEMGHQLPDLPDSNYRQLISGSYRIIHRFEVGQNRIFILAVIHAARLISPILDERG